MTYDYTLTSTRSTIEDIRSKWLCRLFVNDTRVWEAIKADPCCGVRSALSPNHHEWKMSHAFYLLFSVWCRSNNIDIHTQTLQKCYIQRLSNTGNHIWCMYVWSSDRLSFAKVMQIRQYWLIQAPRIIKSVVKLSHHHHHHHQGREHACVHTHTQ